MCSPRPRAWKTAISSLTQREALALEGLHAVDGHVLEPREPPEGEPAEPVAVAPDSGSRVDLRHEPGLEGLADRGGFLPDLGHGVSSLAG